MIEPEAAAGRVSLIRPVPELNHRRVYASDPEGSLTAPVNALPKSIQKTLASLNYPKVIG